MQFALPSIAFFDIKLEQSMLKFSGADGLQLNHLEPICQIRSLLHSHNRILHSKCFVSFRRTLWPEIKGMNTLFGAKSTLPRQMVKVDYPFNYAKAVPPSHPPGNDVSFTAVQA
jgi:hypothetical protein